MFCQAAQELQLKRKWNAFTGLTTYNVVMLVFSHALTLDKYDIYIFPAAVDWRIVFFPIFIATGRNLSDAVKCP